MVAPFNYPLDIPIGTGKMSTLRHKMTCKVVFFLRMGSLVIIFQTDAMMLHLQETWLF